MHTVLLVLKLVPVPPLLLSSSEFAPDVINPQDSLKAELPQPPFTAPTVHALACVCSWP